VAIWRSFFRAFPPAWPLFFHDRTCAHLTPLPAPPRDFRLEHQHSSTFLRFLTRQTAGLVEAAGQTRGCLTPCRPSRQLAKLFFWVVMPPHARSSVARSPGPGPPSSQVSEGPSRRPQSISASRFTKSCAPLFWAPTSSSPLPVSVSSCASSRFHPPPAAL